MIVDEMELVSRLKNVEPLRPEAFEQARVVLRGAIADSGPGPVSEQDLARARHRRRRRTLITRGGAGLGLGLGVAAVAAVALVVTSAPQPPGNPGGPQAASRSASAPAGAKPSPGSRSASPVVNARLMTAAAFIKTNAAPPPGNATLVIRTQTNGSNPPEANYDLYTDSGDYYWAPTEGGLPEAIAGHDNLANGVDAREVAAARYAVNGDLTTARARMVNATPNPFGLDGHHVSRQETGQETAAVKARLRQLGIKRKISLAPPTAAQRQEGIDNYIWNNCTDALTEGAGNPQVRVGVLRLLATVPQVTVKNSTTGGRPTLTLTAGTALFAGTTQQVLTINAKTGTPISSVSNVPGHKPSSIVTYQVSRVTLADIAAGKS